MHESTIARSLLDIAETARIENSLREIQRVKIIVGSLHHIVNEVLLMHFDLLKTSFHSLSGAILEIENREVVLKCKSCSKILSLKESDFTCPQCNSFETEILSGEELYVELIEGV